jgi:hypothetical protein
MFEWRCWLSRAKPAMKTAVPLEPLKGLLLLQPEIAGRILDAELS